MIVKELILKLLEMPQDAPVYLMYVSDFNYESEVLSVEHQEKDWSLREGEYLETSKVVIS